MSQSENEIRFENLISECDLLIKAGKINVIASHMSQLPVAQVPRKYLQSLAKICRRAGLVTHGLRLLQPVIRSETQKPNPTDGEICEYSILLSRNGSGQEALNLLRTIDCKRTPEALTSLAYCYMARWEYAKVVDLLQQYLQTDADEYSKLVARLNLASAYLEVSKFDEAKALATETISLAKAVTAPRIIANALEIRGQIYFRNKDFKNSRSDLKAASEIFGSNQTYDHLFVQQWLAIMQALEEGSATPLLEFRKKAVERKLWESVREADLYTIQVSFDQKILDHLIYGTSWPAYRERIQKMVGKNPSETFVLGSNEGTILNLQSGSLDNETELNTGKKIHQVLDVLLRDFYVPRNMGSLFSELYPEEHFNVNSSPIRVKQLLSRTRKWLVENEIPASIQHAQGTYRLEIHGNFGVSLKLNKAPVASQAQYQKWMQLKERFQNKRTFSAPEACEQLQWSRSHFRLVVQTAMELGELEMLGTGRAIQYLIRAA